MKKYVVLLCLFFAALASAQNPGKNVNHPNSTNAKDEMMAQISLSDLTDLKRTKDSLQKANSILASSNKKLTSEVSNLTIQLDNAKISSSGRESELKKYKVSLAKADTALVNTASNFLYIPYEAYSIEKIALPDFEAISDSELRKNNNEKYLLLKNYGEDIEAVYKFLETASADLNHPFSQAISKQYIQDIKNSSFYLEYLKYPDYRSTYLGNIYVKIITRLSSFDGNHKDIFKDIENELNQCIKTKEDL